MARGFPAGVRFTPVPDPLLASYLEEIGSLDELKVTLRTLWLLYRKGARASTPIRCSYPPYRPIDPCQAPVFPQNRQDVEHPEADRLAGYRHAEGVDDLADLDAFVLHKDMQYLLQVRRVERLRCDQLGLELGE